MKKMAKYLLAVALILVMTTVAFAGCGEKDSSGKLVIGGTGPLTGEASTYGISVQRGAQIAIDEINKAGGINGIKLEFLFEDDEADGTKAKAAFEKLMDNGMQIFMGTVTSGAGVALNDTIKKEGLLQVTPSASQIEAIENPNSFRICFNDVDQGKAMAEYIYQKLGYKKAAILYNQDDSYSSGLYDAFKKRWSELGGTVSADTSFAKAATDFNAQLTKIIGSDAQFLFMPIYAEKASQIVIAANNKNMKLPIIGCDGLDGILNYLEGDNAKLVEGLIYYTPFIASDASEKVQSFVTKFKEKYNLEPDQFAADAYDAVYVIKAAIEKAGLTVDDTKLSAKELGDKLVPVMTQIEVDGLTGKMTFSASGEPTKSAKVAIIKDGKYAAKD
ncbi:MAG: ABC transporter substrate-binding protein [Acutalibacteraceae bacterium]|jgi:branched-chain amino acid transport system substrate-binding protein